MRWPWSSKEKRLRCASRNGDVVMVRELLETGNVDLDARDEELGWSALHWASSRGHVHVVGLLLKANAAVDATTRFGQTALHWATNCAPIVEMLLKANATVDASSEFGRTPLHLAVYWGNLDVVRMLLAAGANPHAKDKGDHNPLHNLIKPRPGQSITTETLEILQVLVRFGATWDPTCDSIVAAGEAYREAPALALCASLWAQEQADCLPLTPMPIEVVKRGRKNTQAYIESLRTSREIVLRHKICLVGASCAGKTSFIKSITAKQPQFVHLDYRTIGIDHFPLRFEQHTASQAAIKIHEVTFWDFAGQDAYQVAHSLFFSPRTLFLVCIDLEAFAVAYLQASIMSDIQKQMAQLMDEFIERTVLQWIRMIVARQPDADFVFIVTKEDLLSENSTTERLLKATLKAKLKDVEASTQEMRYKLKTKKTILADDIGVSTSIPDVVYVSCTSPASVQSARSMVEVLINNSDRGFRLPDTYNEALKAIIAMRVDAETKDITTRLNQVFAPVDLLPIRLNLKPDLCQLILQTLHDLGDVLWYEDLGVELFQDRVILDPLLMIDFIRQVINHNHTGQIMPHTDLKALPYWIGLSDKEQMKAMKQVLQEFHLVYSTDEDRSMAWDSDLIVPAYWKTKTPASWLFLGDVLRINDTKSFNGEAARVEWEYHFDFGLPASLFDHLVVASVSPFFTFDAGPDWIVYEDKGIAACRIMVGRDVKSLHRTMHVEAVVSESATAKQTKVLWSHFQHLVRAFVDVLREYPGLAVSSFAWDDSNNKVGFKRLLQSSSDALPMTVPWMPPVDTWAPIKELMLKKSKTKSDK